MRIRGKKRPKREQKEIRKIIKIYKSHRYMWDAREKLYLNYEAKRKVYQQMHEQYKLYDDTATFDYVKSTFLNMRSTYKTQFKKVIASRVHGPEEYKPSLWYFNDFLFLDEKQNIVTEISSSSEDEDEVKISPANDCSKAYVNEEIQASMDDAKENIPVDDKKYYQTINLDDSDSDSGSQKNTLNLVDEIPAQEH